MRQVEGSDRGREAGIADSNGGWAQARGTRGAHAPAALLISALLVSGCSLILNSDKQQCRSDGDCRELFGSDAGYACSDNFCARVACRTDQDCVASTGPGGVCANARCQADPTWSCLDSPRSASRLPGPFAVKLHIRDTLTQAPLAGVSARICDKLDFTCASPHGGSQITDTQGELDLQIPGAFFGYIELTLSGYKDTLYFFNPPIDHDTSDLTPVNISAPDVHAGLAQRTGATLMPDRGTLLLESVDCQDQPIAGVSYDTNDKDQYTVPFYSKDGLPDTNATATDSFAFGGYINMQPGIVSVTGRLRDRQRTLGTVSVLIRANTITYGRMAPAEQ